MDKLGLTFEQLVEEFSVPKRDVREIRAAHKLFMRGKTNTHPLLGDKVALPIVRHVQDGDLTKFVQQTADGLETETVVVPMLSKRGATGKTLCVSSQVGCARGCAFCETAQMGLLRSLSAGEIVSQVVAAQQEFSCEVRNVVFMGMGEPFDNFDRVIQAIQTLTDGSGMSIGMERIAISTVGLSEGIRKLAGLAWRRVNLAISLNAPNNDIRSQLMPVNRIEPMEQLREALLDYPLRNCQYFMMEYVLIPGVNNAREHALELSEFLRPVKCMVNVIPYNPRSDSPWRSPTEDEISRFLEWIKEGGQECRRRITKGRTKMAACGQLGNQTLRKKRVMRDSA